ncbi:hypothetical protein [Actinoplanes sp. NPDC049802]|uniref:hypothetical protein n=1 Tax=Actinoplanes sp. NPDC049802 TaxID=3154742 RepID=UPI0033D234D0
MDTVDPGLGGLSRESAEADAVEQVMPVIETSEEPAPAAPSLEADAADAVEQQQIVVTDEEEYRR